MPYAAYPPLPCSRPVTCQLSASASCTLILPLSRGRGCRQFSACRVPYGLCAPLPLVEARGMLAVCMSYGICHMSYAVRPPPHGRGSWPARVPYTVSPPFPAVEARGLPIVYMSYVVPCMCCLVCCISPVVCRMSDVEYRVPSSPPSCSLWAAAVPYVTCAPPPWSRLRACMPASSMSYAACPLLPVVEARRLPVFCMSYVVRRMSSCPGGCCCGQFAVWCMAYVMCPPLSLAEARCLLVVCRSHAVCDMSYVVCPVFYVLLFPLSAACCLHFLCHTSYAVQPPPMSRPVTCQFSACGMSYLVCCASYVVCHLCFSLPDRGPWPACSLHAVCNVTYVVHHMSHVLFFPGCSLWHASCLHAICCILNVMYCMSSSPFGRCHGVTVVCSCMLCVVCPPRPTLDSLPASCLQVACCVSFMVCVVCARFPYLWPACCLHVIWCIPSNMCHMVHVLLSPQFRLRQVFCMVYDVRRMYSPPPLSRPMACKLPACQMSYVVSCVPLSSWSRPVAFPLFASHMPYAAYSLVSLIEARGPPYVYVAAPMYYPSPSFWAGESTHRFGINRLCTCRCSPFALRYLPPVVSTSPVLSGCAQIWPGIFPSLLTFAYVLLPLVSILRYRNAQQPAFPHSRLTVDAWLRLRVL